MPGDATGGSSGRSRPQVVAVVAIGVAVIGVFCTWTKTGPVTLNGTQGPNDGWLVVILAVPALVWARSLARGSYIGIVGVIGTALVIAWVTLTSWRDSREVLDAEVGYGLLLVLVAGIALAAAGVWRGVELLRLRRASADPREAAG